jgi:TolA-binding protein
MKYHGLVFTAFVCVTPMAFGQTRTNPEQQEFLPPVIRNVDSGPESTPPRPNEPEVPASLEAELEQFRSELREFQALREEVSKSTQATDQENDRLSQRHRQDLLEILTRMSKVGARRKPTASTEPNRTESSSSTSSLPPAPMPAFSSPEITPHLADPFALGKVLFRTGDFVNAEKAFRRVTATIDNESTLNYLIATCLRRQSKWEAAITVYKVVAESERDPSLSALAKWQIDNIRWHQDSEAQLEQMRIEREKPSIPAKSPSSQPTQDRRDAAKAIKPNKVFR